MVLETEILVIGGGPAGLAAAIAARKKGFEVMVADGARPPIDKACGEGLMPNTLAALRELGIEIHPWEGKIFRGVRFLEGSTNAEANFHEACGVGLSRTALHDKMVKRAQACGVSLQWNTTVSGLTEKGAVLDGREVRAEWIIGADGIHSRVRNWIGLDSDSREKNAICTKTALSNPAMDRLRGDLLGSDDAGVCHTARRGGDLRGADLR